MRRALGLAITRALAVVGLCLLVSGHAAAQMTDPIEAGRALARGGRLEDAVAAYTRILEARPDDLEARKERGRVLGWLQRNHEALDDFDRVLTVTPRDAEARLGRGRILAHLQRYPEAEAEYRRAFADDPRSAAEAWVEIGRLRFWQDDRAGARAAYDEALRLEPTNAEARAGLTQIAAADTAARVAGQIAAARELAREGRLENAVAAYTRILEARPEDLEARKERGRVLGLLQRNHEALDDFDRVLTVTSRDAEARLGRGRILARLQRYPEAEAEYRRAFADDPRAAAEAWVEIGRLRCWQDDRAGARAAYDEALRLEPTNAEARAGLTQIAAADTAARVAGQIAAARELAREGRLENAVAAYTRILEARPEDLEARKERGRVLGLLQRNHEALDDFDRVLTVTPRDAEARLGRGRILARLQRYPEAEAEYRRAIDDDPRAAPEAWVEIGRVRFWQEDRAGAGLAYDEALRLEPTNAEAQQGLALLAAAPVPWRWRLDAGFRFDALTKGNSNWYWEWGRLAFRPWKGTTVLAGIDQYHRFDKNDTQASIGVAQDLAHGFTVSGSFTYGFNPSVVANQIYAVEIVQGGWIPRVIPSLRYQHSDFPGSVHVDIVAPGVEVSVTPDVAVLLRYYYSRVSGAGSGNAGSINIVLFPERRVSFSVGAAYGNETFLAGTVQQVTESTVVTTAAAGLTWRITQGRGLRLNFEYEDRRDSYKKYGVGTSMFFEF